MLARKVLFALLVQQQRAHQHARQQRLLFTLGISAIEGMEERKQM